MKSSEKEIIIIGQGLAGSSIALEFEDRGIFPVVIDNHHYQASSKIAAGLWNPVSFRNMKTVWMAEECLRINDEKYPAWEKKLGTQFYHPTQLVRIHRDAEEVNNWDVGKEKNPYLQHTYSSKPIAHASCGCGEVSHCGWMNVPQFIHSTAQHLKNANRLMHDLLTPEKIHSFLGEGKTVVLCTGYQAPWPWWPVNPNKGEVIELNTNHALEAIVHFSHFVIPLNDNQIKMGSTYQLDPSDMEPTQQGREELEQAFKETFSSTFEVCRHQAGYRPTTGDRRPVLGRLSSDQSLFIFSGLGSRGVLMAPLHAQMLVRNILDGSKIHPEADVVRYLRRRTAN